MTVFLLHFCFSSFDFELCYFCSRCLSPKNSLYYAGVGIGIWYQVSDTCDFFPLKYQVAGIQKKTRYITPGNICEFYIVEPEYFS